MAPAEHKGRDRLWFAVRLLVAAGALTWTLSRVSLREMARAAARVSVFAALASVGLTFFALLLAGLRSRVFLRAYGAENPPSVRSLARLHLIGLFYNTFLPGNVGGDVVRAHATRAVFGGGAGAYMVVGIERVFGLAGLLTLTASVLAVHPVFGVRHLGVLSVVGLCGAVAAVLAPFVGRKLTFLPGPLGRLAGTLPVVRRPVGILGGFLLSLCTQTTVAMLGHVLIASIHPSVRVADSLVLVPLAAVAAYFPATVAGIGVREAAFVGLFAAVGVPRADATAASLAFLASQLVVALVGGLVHLLERRQS